MNEHTRPDEVFEIEPRESGGLLDRLPWWLIAGIAFVVADTAHPAIGVIVLCLKFGWNDFLTAMWLRRRDPDRQRGATCSWFYCASGLWRVCVWSFGLLFVILILIVLTELKPGPPRQVKEVTVEALTCLCVWLVSSASATLLTMLAVFIAWKRGRKVWISGSMTASRRRNLWPPQPRSTGRNLLRWWLVTTGVSLFLTLFTLGLTVLLSFVGNVRPGNGPPPQIAEVLGALLGALIPIISAFAILLIGSHIFVRIGAITPADCWPELAELGYPIGTEVARQRLGLPETKTKTDARERIS